MCSAAGSIRLVVIVIFVWGERWALDLTLFVGTQIGTGFAVSILMILIVWIINILISPIQDPPEWAQLSYKCVGLGYFTLAGALFGTTAGYALMRVRVNFQTQGPWWKKAVRYLLGIAVCSDDLGLDQFPACWQRMKPSPVMRRVIFATARSHFGRHLSCRGFS